MNVTMFWLFLAHNRHTVPKNRFNFLAGEFELSSLMLKKFELLSFTKKIQKSSKNLAKKGENALKKS